MASLETATAITSSSFITLTPTTGDVKPSPAAQGATLSLEKPLHGRNANEPVKLCSVLSPFDTDAMSGLLRTTRYAQNPILYLQQTLGPDVFRDNWNRFCLAPEIDKDMYGKGKHQQHFEQHIATLLGKRHGTFFITGVQAQCVALKVYCTSSSPSSHETTGALPSITNNIVAWHSSSHLETAEHSAYRHLYGLSRILLGSQTPEKNPTLDDILSVLTLPSEQRPQAILLEIPNRRLGCRTYTYTELQQISSACRAAGVRLHCDGARLWEIEPYYQATAGKTFRDIGQLFDSVYVSFYKGLGGASGAILVSDDETFIDAAKIWRRRAGGNVFSLPYQIIDDERGFNENIGSFRRKWRKMQDVSHAILQATHKFTSPDGKPIIEFTPRIPTCCQTHTRFCGFTAAEILKARDLVERDTGIRVLNRLRPDPNDTPDEPLRVHVVEWMIRDENEHLPTHVFVAGFVALCRTLLRRD